MRLNDQTNPWRFLIIKVLFGQMSSISKGRIYKNNNSNAMSTVDLSLSPHRSTALPLSSEVPPLHEI